LKLLLDTCTLLWWAGGKEKLSKTAQDVLLEPSNEIHLSAVSCWEIAIKYSSGRLFLPAPPDAFIPALRTALRLTPLPLDDESSFQEQHLPRIHADPFDRMLVCQAILHNLVIVTPDPLIARYPVRVIW